MSGPYFNSCLAVSFLQVALGLLDPGQSIILQFSALSFSCEVDVAVEANDGLGLVSRLSHARRSRERVGTDSCRAIEVLSGEVLGPDGRRLLHGVVTLGHLHLDFVIRLLLATSPGAMLDDQLLVLLVN